MRERAANVLAKWGVIFVIDGLRYAIPASIAFAVFWIWKWDALVHRRIQARRPKRKALAREVRYSISTAFIFSLVGLATFYGMRAHVFRNYDHISDYGWPWWFASIGIAILVHDAYFYWTHRAMHLPFLYRWFHRVHHLSTSPSPLAAYAFAPLEALVNALIAPFLICFIPMHGSALFVFLVYMIVMNVVAHLGIELYPRGFTTSRWTRWISTSTHHNLHHRDFEGNYGFYFTWWDRWMGTQHAEYHETFASVTQQPATKEPSPMVYT